MKRVLVLFTTIWFVISGVSASMITNLTPSADVYINSISPSIKYGGKDYLWVRSWIYNGTNNSMKIYLQFALPSDTASIETASLVLTRIAKAGSAYSYTLYGLKKGSMGEKWTERGTVWNNAPANVTDSPSAFTADAVCLATVDWAAGDEGSTVSMPSTADFVAFLNTFRAGDVVTLMISQNGESGGINRLASKENTIYSGPVLMLTYAKK
ncbi:MAG: DNRLRE domain-containing protein [Kiritimatiellales bacterium]